MKNFTNLLLKTSLAISLTLSAQARVDWDGIENELKKQSGQKRICTQKMDKKIPLSKILGNFGPTMMEALRPLRR